MELCTNNTITPLPSATIHHGYLAANDVHLIKSRVSLPLRRNLVALRLQSRTLRCARKFPGETVSGETSTGVKEFDVEKREGTITVEDKNVTSEVLSEDVAPVESSEDVQTQVIEFMDDFKLDSDNTYSLLLYGSGAIVALYLTSAIVGSLESIPLFPKLMEVVGLGYTFWFTTRYLLFKKNREELKTKISEIKKQVLGSDME